MIDFIIRMLRYLWGIQFWRFAAMGVASASVGSGTYLFCYMVLGVYYQTGNAIGFCAAITVSFLLNKYVAFRSRTHRAAWGEVPKYALQKLLFYSMSAFLLYIGVERMRFDPMWVQPAVVALLALPSFITLRRIVFKTGASDP